ncbi:PBP1A family penicillin-binding protein [Paenibacillus xerothermodurans]|uniref:PBP1A family penicillin-binding protein n=1 Tax=Paenibacillus xerothermodurans TaxID=1977292 RepID=A0A2W1P296_PAEXE|nr:PBP1A family penicillin-binding protein [Paenibacillus xerothermodurans]PZE21852.1 PBP1A family penicillin-binding protein [Paenibacillus xerothermodurans]
MSTVKKATTGKTTTKKKKKMGVGRALTLAFVAALVALICALGVYIFIIISGNKILNENWNKLDMDQASHVYDGSGAELALLHGEYENREMVTTEQVPEKLRQAFIATEDQRFEQHAGIDFLGIGRALVKDIVARSAVEGGSTITQQLAKNLFLSNDKTFFRKATEMSIAVALEDKYTKDEILTMYMNRIFFGQRAYGVKAAAKRYFNVSDLQQLKVWQMATLAAIPKAPSVYNPISNPEKSKERRAVVLQLMLDQGYITEQERAEAAAVDYQPPQTTSGNKNYLAFIDYVINEANEVHGISEDEVLRGGYKIYTTMDANAQKIMEQTFANPKFFQKDGPQQKMQGAMAIINHKNGGLVGLVGGRDYVATGLNRAMIMQQPGSSIKPILVYAPALETGKYTPYSMLPDTRENYNGYSPRNYDGVYRGQVTMYDAVKRSINAPAVWLLNELNVRNGIQFAEKLGIQFDKAKDNHLAIALGGMTHGATPVQMAAAYGAFGNNGYFNTTHSIAKIVNRDNETVFEFNEQSKEPVMSAKTAYYMTHMMQGVVEPGGTGAAAKFNRPVAGKTGSTQNVIKGLEKYNRDLWFTGYTPEWSAAVWLGFDKPDAKHYVSMNSGAPAVIFKEVMSKALAKHEMTEFTRPQGVKEPVPPPKGVTDLKAEYVEGPSPAVALSWSPLSEGTSYQILRKEEQEAEFSTEPLTTTEATNVKDILVTPGVTYQYAVVPIDRNSGEPGDRSNLATVTVPAIEGTDPLQPGETPGEFPSEGELPGEGQVPGEGEDLQPGQMPGDGDPGHLQGRDGEGRGTPGQDTPEPGDRRGGAGPGGATAPGGDPRGTDGAGTEDPGTAAPGGGTREPAAGRGSGSDAGSGASQPAPAPQTGSPSGTTPSGRTTPGTGGGVPVTGQSAGDRGTDPAAEPGSGAGTR